LPHGRVGAIPRDEARDGRQRRADASPHHPRGRDRTPTVGDGGIGGRGL